MAQYIDEGDGQGGWSLRPRYYTCGTELHFICYGGGDGCCRLRCDACRGERGGLATYGIEQLAKPCCALDS